MKCKNYTPYPGFYDLRIFALTPKQFSAAWQLQEYLYQMSKQKAYYERYDPYRWEQVKELAAEFQMFLLPLLKKSEKLK